MAVFNLTAGKNNTNSGASTCTVKVNSVDSQCAYLYDKIQVGPNMTKAVVPGPSGLALELNAVSGGGGGGGEGYDSSLPNPLVIHSEGLAAVGADGEWDLYYDGYNIPMRAGMVALAYNHMQEGYTVDYFSCVSKMVDANTDYTKQCYITFATILTQEQSEGTAYVTLGYMDTVGAFQTVEVANAIVIHSDSMGAMELHTVKFLLPVDIHPHSELLINIIPYDSTSVPPASGNSRATGWRCTPPTLYVPVNNYPLNDTQFLTS